MVDFQSRDTRRGQSSTDDTDTKSEIEDEQTDDTDETTDRSASDGAVEVDATDSSETGDGTERPDYLQYAVVTVSKNGTVKEDGTGNRTVSAIEEAGDEIVTRELIQPTYDSVQNTIVTLVGREDVEAIVVIGGTGVGPTDIVPEAVGTLFDKDIPGFGELFRTHEREIVGTSVLGCRVTAGIIDSIPVFVVPNAVDPASRALEDLVLPEAPRLGFEAGGEKE